MTPTASRSVVVLGASGFLGRHVCAAFAAAGARVSPVSRKARDGVALDLVRAGRPELRRLCAGADAVVNAAGAVWGGTGQEMAELNAELVRRLTEVLAELPERPRFVNLGSAYEYGPVPAGVSIDEDWPPAPATAYGRTKLQGTQAVVRAADEHGVDGVALRVSVACGPGTPKVSLPGIVAGHLAAGDDELRLAPLRAHRDLVDVRDVADAVLAAADAPRGAVAGAVINIGGGAAVPVRDLVELMISLSGRPVRIVEEAVARDTRSDAQWQRLDIGRARRTLGWTPRRTLAESMRDLLTAVGVPVVRPVPAVQPAEGTEDEPTARAHPR
ncbi:NAD(P)-dependent oxidoreductase [Actinomadura sp. DC4]|uniref:NAD-dependent epimerase/dehydratase family protein n=1 Tax=Actinomadura sp. DC4 TaxID=3055069 RepID=UPI0025AF4176|nr:NAD(P)-dependent oxidoreductase [Actinomadura sp. DC4]MDN3355688.1 NAD(P)-dependent oxidoreductase [Actinomadura sp. DC4]